ncbi:O-methyltransferase [Actinokineospora enzanensis]|uniref:O-methyltransferase n=1 Tax=Actinokineospora enzanensis TaxID=155975 RepID=UPI000365374B|nr:class I SAM-dependent methyltransferase [Actinokineospora enzanensis]
MDIHTPALDDYLLAHSTPADALLRELAAETAARWPRATSMQISHDEGEFLTMLTRLVGAGVAVEVGVFTGYSSLCIARGLAPGGRLIACDINEEWTALARVYWERAGVSDLVDLRIAPALDTLRSLPASPHIDFAFIDADKSGYLGYYDELVPRMRPGGVIALDNVLQGGRVVDPSFTDPVTEAVRAVNTRIAADPRVSTTMLPMRDGVTLL